ncbi:MAG TPA: M20/M25/M40 family metallo-hydrolase, partial [Acidimicrobiales bacterium]|jgi:acetylornithine deacetylase/succinyl-diaminopimelate desuccinylase-like protein
MTPSFDAQSVMADVSAVWAADIVPTMHDYIAIPALSPAFDAEWAANGHMGRAVDLVADWCRSRPIRGLTVEVAEIPGRTPLVVMEIPASGSGSNDDPVLLYGHLDKQPEMVGWRDGLGPWTPVLDGERLYGRGGADDGYAAFASLTAIEAVQRAGGSHARCVVLVEASEESGSPDLPAHLAALADRVGTPSLVLCLDSGCADYNRLWATTSLRGLAGGTLVVEILEEGAHSGAASGVVPSTFRIARQLVERVEDGTTGEIRLAELHTDVPDDRRRQVEETAATTAPYASGFRFVPGANPTTDDPVEQILNHTWRPALSTIGADGLPPTTRAGNVLRPRTALQLSFRLPPTCDSDAALAAVQAALTADPPYGARVTFSGRESGQGWNAPPFAPWLDTALEQASQLAWGAPYRAFGEGGTIPFMGMLGRQFPDAQFLITGVLGPESNAHGPNEFLHLPTGERVTAALAVVLDHHATRG